MCTTDHHPKYNDNHPGGAWVKVIEHKRFRKHEEFRIQSSYGVDHVFFIMFEPKNEHGYRRRIIRHSSDASPCESSDISGAIDSFRQKQHEEKEFAEIQRERLLSSAPWWKRIFM